MITKIVSFSALLVVSSAGFLPAVQYTPTSQGIITYNPPQAIVAQASPLAFISSYATPSNSLSNAAVSSQNSGVAISNVGVAPAVYHATPVTLNAGPVAYQAVPQYTNTASSQNIISHNEGHGAVGTIAAAPAVYQANPIYSSQGAVTSQDTIRYNEGQGTIAPVQYAVPSQIAVNQISPIQSTPVLNAAPTHAFVASAQQDHNVQPKYEFAYSIANGQTGDNISQHESRNGAVIQGQYSLVDAGGSLRNVDYSSNTYNGLNAVVSNSAATQYSTSTPVLAPPYNLGHH